MKMKRWLCKAALVATVVLPALSYAAEVQNSDDFGCSNATLKGEYAFGVTNFNVPQVVAGIKIFDGHGNLTQRDYMGDGLQLTPPETDFSPKGQETGTYKVNSDCTGSMVINLNVPNTPPPHGMIKIMFVISNGGRHIHEVVSQFIPPGSTQPAPTQTSADDWKVASDEKH
jgi:hypothetical protein